MGVAILEFVLIAPGELLREALLDFLVRQPLANAGIDLVQILDGSFRTGYVLNRLNCATQLRGPYLDETTNIINTNNIYQLSIYTNELRLWTVRS